MMQKLILLLIRFYQTFISPMLGSNCRFYPTCSHYTYQAIEIHGVAKGGWLGVKRVLRCNPFNPGGFDPVPGLPSAPVTDTQSNATDAHSDERGE